MLIFFLTSIRLFQEIVRVKEKTQSLWEPASLLSPNLCAKFITYSIHCVATIWSSVIINTRVHAMVSGTTMVNRLTIHGTQEGNSFPHNSITSVSSNSGSLTARSLF